MIFDSMEMFYDNADITGASAEIDLGGANKPTGSPIKIAAVVPNAANDGTIAIQHSDTSGAGFASVATFNVTAADLKKGLEFALTPSTMKRYIKCVVTTTTGTGWIGLVQEGQTNL